MRQFMHWEIITKIPHLCIGCVYIEFVPFPPRNYSEDFAYIGVFCSNRFLAALPLALILTPSSGTLVN